MLTGFLIFLAIIFLIVAAFIFFVGRMVWRVFKSVDSEISRHSYRHKKKSKFDFGDFFDGDDD